MIERSFEELVEEANTVSVEGWDFSWLEGRALEVRPSWRYQRSMGERMGRATAALDIQTGGGEVLAGVPKIPQLCVATESWPPNIAKATKLLHPRGVAVVVDSDQPPLPFADNAFDLVVSRHPIKAYWEEIARVLKPGGIYYSQQVGPDSVLEISEYFLGPMPDRVDSRHPAMARKGCEDAGLEVIDLRMETLRTEFYDVGAVIYFLRKVIWIVPGFTVEMYMPQLKALHEKIKKEGSFKARTTRFIIEARKHDEPEDVSNV
jgi:SAM-dependent methyltransferase